VKTLILIEDPYFDWWPFFWIKTLILSKDSYFEWRPLFLSAHASTPVSFPLDILHGKCDSSFCWVFLFFLTMEFFFLTMEIMQTGIGSILAQMSKCVNLGCLSFLLWFRKHNLITTPKNASITLFSAEVRPTCIKTLELPGHFKKLRPLPPYTPNQDFLRIHFGDLSTDHFDMGWLQLVGSSKL